MILPLLFFALLPALTFWTGFGVVGHSRIAECGDGRDRVALTREVIRSTVVQSTIMLVVSLLFEPKWNFRWWTVPLGMVMTDTFQDKHHGGSQPIAIVCGLGLFVVLRNALQFSFVEFSILVSLFMIARVREFQHDRK